MTSRTCSSAVTASPRSSSTACAASAQDTSGPGGARRLAVRTARSQSTGLLLTEATVRPAPEGAGAAAAGDRGGEPVQRGLRRPGPADRHGVGGEVEGQQPTRPGAHQPGQRPDAVEGARLGAYDARCDRSRSGAVAVVQRPVEPGHGQPGQHRRQPWPVTPGDRGQQPGDASRLHPVEPRQPAAVEQRDRSGRRSGAHQLGAKHPGQRLRAAGEARRPTALQRHLADQRLGQVVVAAGQHRLDQLGDGRAEHPPQLARAGRCPAAQHRRLGTPAAPRAGARRPAPGRPPVARGSATAPYDRRRPSAPSPARRRRR